MLARGVCAGQLPAPDVVDEGAPRRGSTIGSSGARAAIAALKACTSSSGPAQPTTVPYTGTVMSLLNLSAMRPEAAGRLAR